MRPGFDSLYPHQGPSSSGPPRPSGVAEAVAQKEGAESLFGAAEIVARPGAGTADVASRGNADFGVVAVAQEFGERNGGAAFNTRPEGMRQEKHFPIPIPRVRTKLLPGKRRSRLVPRSLATPYRIPLLSKSF